MGTFTANPMSNSLACWACVWGRFSPEDLLYCIDLRIVLVLVCSVLLSLVHHPCRSCPTVRRIAAMQTFEVRISYTTSASRQLFANPIIETNSTPCSTSFTHLQLLRPPPFHQGQAMLVAAKHRHSQSPTKHLCHPRWPTRSWHHA